MAFEFSESSFFWFAFFGAGASSVVVSIEQASIGNEVDDQSRKENRDDYEVQYHSCNDEAIAAT